VIVPETRYVVTADGVYLAYQVVGHGPVDVALGLHSINSNVDLIWDDPDWRPFIIGIAEQARLIIHDRRGLGASSRNVPPPNLEIQAGDLLAVLDAVGSSRPILVSGGDSAAVHVLLAATHPERVRGLVWNNPMARTAWAPDYPWGETAAEMEAWIERAPRWWGSSEQASRIAAARLRERLSLADNMPIPAISADDVNTYARIFRNVATPDVAADLYRMDFETDVRSVLPLVQAPAVLLTGTLDNEDEARLVGSLMPNATVYLVEGRSGLALEPFLRAFRSLAGLAEPTHALETVLATVLFTDIVGSTEQQAALGDRAWRGFVERHHQVVRVAVDRWRGVERDTAGDGFFVTFDGPARAIRCAQDIVRAVRPLGLEVRAGLHTGECEELDGKLGGIAVAIGARVAGVAAPSQVLVSQTVRDLVAGSGFAFHDAGEHQLKGVPGTWRLWSVPA
jgi:class 3 adenylate cyclase